MKKVTAIILSIVLVAGAAFAVDQVIDDAKTKCWRYKIIVNIQTPEGMKSGDAVREACLTPFEGFNPSIADFKESVVGEAVVIDLVERGVAFAIMDRDGSIFDIENAFKGPKLYSQEGINHYSSIPVGSKAELKKDLPWLVTFENLNNPKTVRSAGAPVTEDVFGNGVSMDSVFIEITDEPVTWNVENWLPWLPKRKNIKGYLGSSSELPFKDLTETYLNGVEFSRGRYWLQNE